MTDGSIPLIVRRRISASRQQLFDAFTSTENLLRWFVPSSDVTLEVIDFSFEPKGRFRFCWHTPDGRKPTVSGVFQIIEPAEFISMTWVWEPPDPLENIPMNVSFRFIAHGDATEIVLTHEGIPSNEACTVHANGWAGTLTALAEFLEKEHT